MTRAVRLRLFLDSNVLTGGILAPWGLDKAVLSLCAARICRMVLAEVVRLEAETNLLSRASSGETEAQLAFILVVGTDRGDARGQRPPLSASMS